MLQYGLIIGIGMEDGRSRSRCGESIGGMRQATIAIKLITAYY